MIIDGVIELILTDGYERVLVLNTVYGKLCGNYLQSNEYLAPGEPSKYIGIDEKFSFSMVINFICKYQLVGAGADKKLTQSIVNSPHASLVGEIVEKLDSDSYLLLIDNEIKLRIEFEMDVELTVGDFVLVDGELTIEQEGS